MTFKDELESHFKSHSFKTNLDNFYSIYWEQKITYSIVEFISKLILNYVDKNGNSFTKTQLLDQTISNELCQKIFLKPPSDKIPNEIDKMSQQPVNLLWLTGILEKKEEKLRNANLFKLINKDLLIKLIDKEDNIIDFLSMAAKKYVDLLPFKNNFYDCLNDSDTRIDRVLQLKRLYFNFIKKNTPVNSHQHINRMFNKLFNQLAYDYGTYGIKGGTTLKRISKNDISYLEINFRDIDKPKHISRDEFLEKYGVRLYDNEQKINDAKKYVKDNNPLSIVHEFNPESLSNSNPYAAGKIKKIINENQERDKYGVHAHHIFSQVAYPEYAATRENIVNLNAQEHLAYAHSDGNTRDINPEYQYFLCVVQTRKIFQGSDKNLKISNWIDVLNTGCGHKFDMNDNENEIIDKLSEHYFQN